MSDVVLGSAMRTNLLSLQNTQRLIDKTQERLATGLKVNSALDNAQNFFAAQSLNNRAGDLSRLLDGISQSIRTIEEADKGVTAMTKLIEQADSISVQARDAMASISSASVAASDNSALATNPNAALVGTVTGVVAGDQFSITTADGTSETFTIQADTTAKSLVAQINDRAATVSTFKASASIDSNGQISIRSTDGSALRLTDAAGDDSLRSLGFFAGATAAASSENILVGNSLKVGLTGSGPIDRYTALQDTDQFGPLDATATFEISVNGGTATSVTVNATATIDDLVDAINTDADLEGLTASFDEATGTLSFTADSSVEYFSIEITDAVGDPTAVTGFGTTFATGVAQNFQPSGGSASDTLSKLEADFNEVRKQIDSLVKDANYRGVNLLQGDNLTTYFSEDQTSSLVTKGVDFTATGLGLSTADFSSSTAIQQSIDEVRGALTQVRDYGSAIANSLSLIQMRQEFTEGTINTLKAGALDLTKADENEEGANLLALQTRQQLGVTSLSLASQSQQSVLRLF